MGIWGYVGRQTGRLLLGLVGAFLLAASIAALSHAGTDSFLRAFSHSVERALRFDFGSSEISSVPAVEEIAQSLPITFELMAAGLLVALIVGIPVGLLFGTGRFFRPVAPLIQVITAVPVFCAALLAIWIAHAGGLDAFSHREFVSLLAHGASTLAIARVAGIPVAITGTPAAGAIQLALHRAVVGAMREPFYDSMRHMGLSGFEIDRAFLAPYLLIGFFKSLGEIALALFAADAVVEWVFDWPGAISLLIHSVALRDWNVAAVVVLVIASVVIAADYIGQIGARVVTGATQ